MNELTVGFAYDWECHAAAARQPLNFWSTSHESHGHREHLPLVLHSFCLSRPPPKPINMASAEQVAESQLHVGRNDNKNLPFAAEIRKIIWKYALGGAVVRIPVADNRGRDVYAVASPLAPLYRQQGRARRHHSSGPRTCRIRPALHVHSARPAAASLGLAISSPRQAHCH